MLVEPEDIKEVSVILSVCFMPLNLTVASVTCVLFRLGEDNLVGSAGFCVHQRCTDYYKTLQQRTWRASPCYAISGPQSRLSGTAS